MVTSSTMIELFFPKLARRLEYKEKASGGYLSYRSYKQEIRQDCKLRCYYCDAHEREVGGAEHMQLDHFRPKSLPQFEHLENDPINLVYACAACNRLKWNDWPAGDEHTITEEGLGYIDRFDDDNGNVHEYVTISDDGRLEPRNHPAPYVIAHLALNREARRMLREIRLTRAAIIVALDSRISVIGQHLEETADDGNTDPASRELLKGDLETFRLLRQHMVNQQVCDSRFHTFSVEASQ